jgi:hypothetical protein
MRTTPVVDDRRMNDQPTGIVRVPWRHGTVVSAKPAPAEPRSKRAELCALKAKQITQDIEQLDATGKELAKPIPPPLRDLVDGKVQKSETSASASRVKAAQQKREAIDRQVAFQRRRLAWLSGIAAGKDAALEARMRKLEAQLAPTERAYMDVGLPERLAGDQRLLDLLGELALLRFALEVR